MPRTTSLTTLLTSVLLCARALAFDGYLEVSNETGYDMHNLQISHESSDSWEEDVLGKSIMRDGDSVRVDLSGYRTAVFDVRATDEGGDTYTFMGVDVSERHLVLTLDDIDADEGEFEGYVEVTNRTGYTLVHLYVSHENSKQWEEDVLDKDVLASGESVRVDISGYDSSSFDIRAVDEDGDAYTRWSVDVASDDVTFTGKDRD